MKPLHWVVRYDMVQRIFTSLLHNPEPWAGLQPARCHESSKEWPPLQMFGRMMRGRSWGVTPSWCFNRGNSDHLGAMLGPCSPCWVQFGYEVWSPCRAHAKRKLGMLGPGCPYVVLSRFGRFPEPILSKFRAMLPNVGLFGKDVPPSNACKKRLKKQAFQLL